MAAPGGGNFESYTIPIGNGDLNSLMNYLMGPISGSLPLSAPGPVVEDFKKIAPSTGPDVVNTYLVKYKDMLEENMETTKDTPEHQKWCIEYCDLLMNVYDYDRSQMMTEIADKDYLPAIEKLVHYHWKHKNDAKAVQYLLKLAEAGNDKYCEYGTSIYIENKNETIRADIAKYYETLFDKVKNAKTCEWYMLLNVYLGDYETASQIYAETKALVTDMKPIDMKKCFNSGLPNQVIYGEENPFSKDDMTNKYVNKLNPPWGKQFGKCPICLDENMELIPFDCMHQVCAQKCYPRIILDSKQKCPQCRSNTA